MELKLFTKAGTTPDSRHPQGTATGLIGCALPTQGALCSKHPTSWAADGTVVKICRLMLLYCNFTLKSRNLAPFIPAAKL